jgi:integrase
LRKHLKPAAKKLGLSGVTWHLLRHSHATMLDGVGTPIGTMQALLGHSAPEITREIYLHAIPEEQRRAVESVERLVLGPKLDPSSASNAEVSATVH